MVRFTQYARLVHYKLNIFVYLKHIRLLRKTDQYERDLN